MGLDLKSRTQKRLRGWIQKIASLMDPGFQLRRGSEKSYLRFSRVRLGARSVEKRARNEGEEALDRG